MAVLGSCGNGCLTPRWAPFSAQKLNSKIGKNLLSDMAVLGSCCNACFYAPPSAIFGTSSQVSHFLHHAFHFCFIRALRQWRRGACRSNYDTANARPSVLGATSAAQRGVERKPPSLKKTLTARNFPNLKTRCSLLVSLMTP